MHIEFTSSTPLTRQNLKVGDVFTRVNKNVSDNDEVYLTIKINDEMHFVRLSDGEVFEKYMLSLDDKVYRHCCTLTVET